MTLSCESISHRASVENNLVKQVIENNLARQMAYPTQFVEIAT
ncbi:hypothetical protein [Yersinia rohdei]|nr:hypothetical protein [Yersinia rohdei]EEQ04061.1 hypothetical protein yrohd0001_36850 [Yersinia rohdei ATCC 43380]